MRETYVNNIFYIYIFYLYFITSFGCFAFKYLCVLRLRVAFTHYIWIARDGECDFSNFKQYLSIYVYVTRMRCGDIEYNLLHVRESRDCGVHHSSSALI